MVKLRPDQMPTQESRPRYLGSTSSLDQDLDQQLMTFMVVNLCFTLFEAMNRTQTRQLSDTVTLRRLHASVTCFNHPFLWHGRNTPSNHKFQHPGP